MKSCDTLCTTLFPHKIEVLVFSFMDFSCCMVKERMESLDSVHVFLTVITNLTQIPSSPCLFK